MGNIAYKVLSSSIGVKTPGVRTFMHNDVIDTCNSFESEWRSTECDLPCKTTNDK